MRRAPLLWSTLSAVPKRLQPSSGRSAWIPIATKPTITMPDFVRQWRPLSGRQALHSRAGDQPSDDRSPLLLQTVFHSLGRHDEEQKYVQLGIKRAEDALRLHPENADPAALGASVFAALGERKRAMEWLTHARWQSRATPPACGTTSPVPTRSWVRSIGPSTCWRSGCRGSGPRPTAMVQERSRSRSHSQPPAVSEAVRARQIVIAHHRLPAQAMSPMSGRQCPPEGRTAGRGNRRPLASSA